MNIILIFIEKNPFSEICNNSLDMYFLFDIWLCISVIYISFAIELYGALIHNIFSSFGSEGCNSGGADHKCHFAFSFIFKNNNKP